MKKLQKDSTLLRERKNGTEKEKEEKEARVTEEINSCKTEEKMNVERITKIPSGKIVQEMEKKTKGLAGEQAWLLMA